MIRAAIAFGAIAAIIGVLIGLHIVQPVLADDRASSALSNAAAAIVVFTGLLCSGVGVLAAVTFVDRTPRG
ncbi:hypothetical protein GCM10025867_51650 (plasmid) [Frondihabitans sucicola]|uniref:Uncharacterized protein n=1 Tax=Frondihabitans sucicola TaxID=1268041 RepID=A0ABN6Y4U8_9MICO|nr:hypothetical protein [Frondihabitans sucicola]BDZ52357.1 hypothetical protein GCM10025867_45980 [Frondihabitans sucicola]BDZ52924.1 hypothetical protein GCM10025867_51650 [Frondihabitans sucicola]